MAATSIFRRLCFFPTRGCFHSRNENCSRLCRFIKGAILAVLPIALWLILFVSAKFIPSSWRPSISVDTLPALDELLFVQSFGLLCFSGILVAAGWLITGSPMSTMVVFVPLVLRGLRDLAQLQSVPADVLAFIPYGLLHYISPALFALWLWWYAGIQSAVVFAQAFGVQNVLGVLTQLLFPTAAPWYNDKNGFKTADYSMPGDPAGLARVDDLFGTNMYKSAFNNSPLVFGAMPSLHSAFAVLIMFFAMHFNRKLGSVMTIYMCWQWWATMYLRHHYMVDLIVGGAYAAATYGIARRFLSRPSLRVMTAGGDYKPLDVDGWGGEKLWASAGWADSILKSRRAPSQERASNAPIAQLETVIVDGP
ncbi:hypothetical protein HDU85_007346 [Gaertneriomyces sp. JEL0708]|nr:hypothetical protein HDU85_007346 [Gaertneriomyces sp. JEL0708]